jgi:hypothetical protein
MSSSRVLAALASASLALSGALVPSATTAVTSATFTFDYLTDPGDIADGSDFDVTGVAPIDDTATMCDAVVMVMVDGTGTPTDVDSFCLAIATGMGGSDGDYGSFGTGYLPVVGPVTYALYDLTADDLAALTGFGDSDQEYFDYVVANCTLLAQDFQPVQALASGTPFSFSGGFGAGSAQCYSAKDLKSPKFVPVEDLALADEFGASTVQVKKPAYVCSQAGVDGAPAPATDAHTCCYKMKGTKLSPAAEVQTEDQFGILQQRMQTPKLFCTACTTAPIPAP